MLGVVQFQSHLGLIYVYPSRHRVRRCRDTAKDVCDRGADHCTGYHYCVIIKVLQLFHSVLWFCDWQESHTMATPIIFAKGILPYMHAFTRPAAQSGYMPFILTIITAATAISCVISVFHAAPIHMIIILLSGSNRTLSTAGVVCPEHGCCSSKAINRSRHLTTWVNDGALHTASSQHISMVSLCNFKKRLSCGVDYEQHDLKKCQRK